MTGRQVTAGCGRSWDIDRAWSLRRFGALLLCWHRRAVERRQLAEMPRDRLRDISADPDAIRREIAKPFWRS